MGKGCITGLGTCITGNADKSLMCIGDYGQEMHKGIDSREQIALELMQTAFRGS